MTTANQREEVTEVAADDFLEWLSSRGADSAICPICSYNHWNLLTDRDSCALVGMHGFPITVGNMGVGKPFIQLECKRCSYVALFSATEVSKWVRVGKPKFEEAAGNGR